MDSKYNLNSLHCHNCGSTNPKDWINITPRNCTAVPASSSSITSPFGLQYAESKSSKTYTN
jgi:hypothetical protein